MTLDDLVSTQPVDIDAVSRLLDGLTSAQRVAATRTLRRRSLKRLFSSCEGRTLELGSLTPEGTAALRPTRHLGTNDLILFRFFAKPLFRDQQGRVFGRNDHFWSWLTGPGYFEAVRREGRLLFDYGSLPAEVPQGWPTPRNNRRGLSFFVFRGLEDEVRRVSGHVVIGRASRNGRPLSSHFVLVQQD
jgi:hypothetical protein